MTLLRVGALGLAIVALAGCGDASSIDVALPTLLTLDDLGGSNEGWRAEEPGPVPLLPGSVAPPCPFDLDVPDIEVTAADSVEFGNDERGLGVNHTVVALDGMIDPAAAVQQTWEAMNCSDSDFQQSPVDALASGIVRIQLSSRSGPFSQVILIDANTSVMSFVIVSGDNDAPLELATAIADRLPS